MRSRWNCQECADDVRDEVNAQIDAGERCPDCYYRGVTIERDTSAAPPLFRCRCGATWFDSITRPAQNVEAFDLCPERAA